MAVLIHFLPCALCSCALCTWLLPCLPHLPKPLRATSHASRASIMQNEPNFQARPPAERRPRTYFRYSATFFPFTFGNPVAFDPEHAFCLRNWCGAKRVIMQNKPNFQKTKMNPNLCSERPYENKSPPPSPPKQTQSNPIFELGHQPSADPAPTSGIAFVSPHHLIQPTHLQRRTTPRPKKLVRGQTCDYAKQTQFSKNQNEPKPLFRNDL